MNGVKSMGIITKIAKQQNNSSRYNIFINDQYSFSVDEDVLVKFRLKKGMELDEFIFSEIQYEDEIRKAYHMAIKYLTKRMRSEKEVREFLLEKEIKEPIIQEAIHKLYEYKFLDDEEYGRAYVRTKMNTTDKGPELIKMELGQKGLSVEHIEKALLEYPEEKQLENGRKLAEKYMKKRTKESNRLMMQKIEQQLLRKGYPSQIIPIILEEAKENKRDETEALNYQGEKLLRKYGKLNGHEKKMKIKRALFQKGFSLEQIDEFLNQVEEEELD